MLNIILFFGLFFTLLIGSIFRHPIYAFLNYELVYFFNPLNRWWGVTIPNISYSFITVLSMSMVIIFNLKQLKSNNPLSSRLFVYIFIIVFLYFLVTPISAFPKENLDAATIMLKLALTMSFAFVLINSKKDLNLSILFYIAGSLYISIISFQIGRNDGARLESVGTVDAFNANGLANAIAPSVVFVAYFFFTQRSFFYKILFAVTGAFILNCLILLNSRGASIATFAGLSLFFLRLLFEDIFAKQQRTILIIWLLIGSVGFISITDSAYIDRIYSLSQGTEINYEKESGSTRFAFWRAAVDVAIDHPFGVGAYGFQAHSDNYLPQEIHSGESRSRAVHSSWFQALTETGIAGFLTFIVLLITSFSLCRKTRFFYKKNKLEVEPIILSYALEAALFSFLVAATFINRFRAEILYWLILYIACFYNIYFLKYTERPNRK